MDIEGVAQLLTSKLENMEDKFDIKLDAIHTQTKKTNGRVSDIEKWKISHDIDRAKSNSGIRFALTVYGVAILFLLAVSYPKVYGFITSVA